MRQLVQAPGRPFAFSADATRLTRAFSGRYARGIENRFMREMAAVQEDVPAYPVQNRLTQAMRAAANQAGCGFDGHVPNFRLGEVVDEKTADCHLSTNVEKDTEGAEHQLSLFPQIPGGGVGSLPGSERGISVDPRLSAV